MAWLRDEYIAGLTQTTLSEEEAADLGASVV